jgi:hypothetical protein
MNDHSFSFQSDLWLWTGDAPASWHFVTIPKSIGEEIKFFSGTKRGFGSVRVSARIGATRWKTSLFPDKKSGSYLLPVKADVRKAEKIAAGQTVDVHLAL